MIINIMYQDESSLTDSEAMGLLEIENNYLNAQHQNLEFEESHNMSKITEEKPVLRPEEQQKLNYELLQATSNKSTEKVKDLLSKGADINARNNSGNTALIIATHRNNTELTLTLIAARADVNARNNSGETALILATHRNNTESTLALIAARADVNAKNNSGETALKYATNRNNTKSLTSLINAGADVTNDIETFTNIHGTTRLILTAHKERLNEIATAIDQESKRTTPLSDDELKSDKRRKLIIDATNFNKDNIIDALVYKLAKDQVIKARIPKAPIDKIAEIERIQALRNDIYNPNSPERLQTITESLNKILEKYKVEREHEPKNRIPLRSILAVELPAEITATIASYLPEEQPGDRCSDRGAFRVAALSNKKAREAYTLGKSTSKQESSGRGFRR